MAMIPINDFDGIVDSQGNPAIGTASATKGLIRNRTRGWLELADGYETRLAVPVSDTYNTLIVEKDIAHFYVEEHGGKAVSIFIGSYTKVSRYDANVKIPRFGVWMRPYWSGAAWIDAWIELTEIEIVKLVSFTAPSTINITATGTAADYFKNWIAVFEDYTQAQDHDNYLLIQASTTSSITFFGLNSQLDRAADAKIILVRSFVNKELPALVTSFIFNYLNEIRLTSGNLSTDVSLMAGYRKKSYSWATTDKEMDRIVLDVGCLDVWRYAVLINSISAQVDENSPLESGNYGFKIALGTDDNQIASAHEAYIDSVNEMAVKFSIPEASNLFATDGSYIYRPDVANNRIINKYSAIDYTYISAIQIEQTSNAFAFQDILIVGGKLFVAWVRSDTYAQLFIAEVVLSTFTLGTVYTTADGNPIPNAKLTTDGTYLYAVYAAIFVVISPPGISRELRIRKFDLSLSHIAVNTLLPGGHTDVVDYVCTACYAGGYIYTSTLSSNGKTSWFVAIDVASLLMANEVDVGTVGLWFQSMFVLSGYLYYVLTESGVKLERRVLSTLALANSWNIATGVDARMCTDGTIIYAFIRYAASYQIMKTVDIPNSTYGTQLIIESNTSNIQVFTYLYGDGFIIDLAPTTYAIAVDGTQRIDFKLLVSAGAIPARMRYAYLYISRNSGSFYRLKKIDLTVVTNISTGEVTQQAWETDPYYDTVSKHFYHRSATIQIKESDYELIGAEMSVDLGRSFEQSGVVRYVAGAVVDGRVYVGNFYDVFSSKLYENKLLVNCVSGEGNKQIDVFDYTNPINLEDGDGDAIVGIADANKRIFVQKKRTVMLLVLFNDEYDRDYKSSGIGNCSNKGCVKYDDVVFWPDYNSICSFATHSGLREINPDWVQTWKAYSDAQKEASLFVIDRINKCLIVVVGSDIWQYDLVDGRWMQLGYTDIPIAIKQNLEGTIDYLIPHATGITGKIFTIAPGNDRHDAANYSWNWKSNKIDLLKQEFGYASDIIIQGFVVKYDSSFAFQLKAYIDDNATAIMTANIPTGKHIMMLRVPLGTRCKAIIFELLGTTVAENDYIKIKSLQIYPEKVPTGNVTLQ
jgi:hypothetical protein